MLLRNSFISCLKGALLGDCIGERFEFEYMIPNKENACKKIDHIEKEETFLQYTDDTAMTRSIAASFIEKGELDAYDMAVRFSHEYYTDNVYNRNYGSHVPQVFHYLSSLKSGDDVFAAAKKQFNGTGSYGNGSAMRCAPVALYTFGYDISLTVEINKCVSMITHTHEEGIEGALVQCLAIRAALNHRKCRPLDVEKFLAEILECIPDNSPYSTKLKMIPELLDNENNEHNVRSNAFERSIVYAIAMGGDTDTIASMTGAIAGAYHTLEGISHVWQNICEGIDVAETQAVGLYNLHETFSHQRDAVALQRLHRHMATSP